MERENCEDLPQQETPTQEEETYTPPSPMADHRCLDRCGAVYCRHGVFLYQHV